MDARHVGFSRNAGKRKSRANHQRYGVLDDEVCFLPGWFEDTLLSRLPSLL
ncbi:TylF/MycF/NovP-related O-methyltransferase [Mycobacterium sp.]|uniref:TylF/MycF/NovP-related O-methyltransferase n=1 Tax=Mycobacterium sp. TaxID=1785 RepID=UPI003D6C3469